MSLRAQAPLPPPPVAAAVASGSRALSLGVVGSGSIGGISSRLSSSHSASCSFASSPLLSAGRRGLSRRRPETMRRALSGRLAEGVRLALSSTLSEAKAALAVPTPSSLRLGGPSKGARPTSSFAARAFGGGGNSGGASAGGSGNGANSRAPARPPSATGPGRGAGGPADPSSAEVWRARRAQLEEQRKAKNRATASASSASSTSSPAPPPSAARFHEEYVAPSNEDLASALAARRQQQQRQQRGVSTSPSSSASAASPSSFQYRDPAPAPPPRLPSQPVETAAKGERDALAADIFSLSSPSTSSSSSAAAAASDAAASAAAPAKKKGRPRKAATAPAPEVEQQQPAEAAPAPKKRATRAKKADAEAGAATTKKRASKRAAAEAAAAEAESSPLTAAGSPLRALLSRPAPPQPPEEGPPPPPDVHVVENLEEARRVAARLLSLARDGGGASSPAPRKRVWACDTEVAGIDISKESPCGHGRVICFTVYGGEDVDFSVSSAASPAIGGGIRKSSLFVDTLLSRGARSLRSPEEEAEDAAAEAARAVYASAAPVSSPPSSSESAAVEVDKASPPPIDPSDFSDDVNAAALAAADAARASSLASRERSDEASEREARAILREFAPFFEDSEIPKIWHNYSFDRHVLGNHGVESRGFGGDTMHMARLLDSSRGRVKGKGYSLESLSNDRSIMGDLWEKAQDGPHDEGDPTKRAPPKKKGGDASPSAVAAAPVSGDDSVTRSKTSMKALFGVRKMKKDGTPGKVVVLPPVEQLQGSPASRGKWIRYASLDARCTYWLARALERRLRALPCSPDAAIRDATGFGAPVPINSPSGPQPAVRDFSMWDLYRNTWLPFGEVLTDMEAEGVLVDREHLAGAELAATADRAAAVARFRAWASRRVPGAAFMNVCSGPQIRQLLFSGALRQDLFEKGGVWDPEGRDVVAAAVAAEEAAMRAEEDEERRRRSEGGEDADAVPPGVVFASPSASSYPDLPEGITPVDAHLSPSSSSDSDAEDDDGGGAKEKPKLLELSRVFKAPNDAGLVEPGKAKPKKNIDIRLHGLWGRGVPSPLQPPAFTPSGWPAVSTPVLRALSGEPGAALRALAELDGGDGAAAALPPPVAEGADEAAARALLGADEEDEGGGVATVDDDGAPPAPPATPPPRQPSDPSSPPPKGVGTLYSAFGGGREGLEASAAVDALCELAAIDTLLSAFIVPLQGPTAATRVDRDDPTSPLGRIHCSLNINTETGRLSARRPNLQNQPALEKDRYGVRRAFKASEGKTLIVADYGQLELRLLAHMAGCDSMIRAFEAGGDFHSRTALGMYDYIRAEVDAGLCALESGDDGGGGKKDVPLIKDRFGSERRRAKVLNFSIAYGKTAHGLSRDWGVSLEEAQETVDRWYADRPEVREWQTAMRHEAVASGRVRTLLGRTRSLPEAASRVPSLRSHALRAAINTPIQGSAADVATAAMLSIAADPWLRERGWKLLLQVHDEVILEGPKETADDATARVVSLMERPFWGTNPLRVELAVDAKHADNWYEAK